MGGYFPPRFGALWDRRSSQRYEAAPSFDLGDQEVRLVDLDGDGVTDVLRTGTRLECFFGDREAAGRAAGLSNAGRWRNSPTSAFPTRASSLRTPEGRHQFLRRARNQTRREEQSLEPAAEPAAEASEELPLRLDAEEIVGRGRQGRDAWAAGGQAPA